MCSLCKRPYHHYCVIELYSQHGLPEPLGDTTQRQCADVANVAYNLLKVKELNELILKENINKPKGRTKQDLIDALMKSHQNIMAGE